MLPSEESDHCFQLYFCQSSSKGPGRGRCSWPLATVCCVNSSTGILAGFTAGRGQSLGQACEHFLMFKAFSPFLDLL